MDSHFSPLNNTSNTFIESNVHMKKLNLRESFSQGPLEK
jgi:hypothetical protein